MPRFNQQGPMGEGAMTGRKMGKCTNYGESVSSTEEQAIENVGRGGRCLGMKRCHGFGRGRGEQGFAEGETRGFGRSQGAGRGMGRRGGGMGRGRRGF